MALILFDAHMYKILILLYKSNLFSCFQEIPTK